ncbi:hypothetical protein SAMN05446635_0618 [Burkholderia sp. OK233]|nr:hypothetical protein SAMN05446635_0618 [Burkholderia sp. OK233]
MAGEPPKPVSLALDGPNAQAASGKTIEAARRSCRRVFVLSDKR